MNYLFLDKIRLITLVMFLLISGNLKADSSTAPAMTGLNAVLQNSGTKNTNNTDIKPSSEFLKQQLESQIESYFTKIVDKIDSTLLVEQEKLKTNAQLLGEFVNSEIIPLWDVDLTLRLLVGKKTWNSLKEHQIQKLRDSFSRTLHRYVSEGMNYYDGQRMRLVNITFSPKQTKGLVAVELSPIYLPAFTVHFKIAKSSNDWLLYDVMIEGISYVKMKKNQYRQIVKQNGVEGLMAYLNKKNSIQLDINKDEDNTKRYNQKSSKVKIKESNDPIIKS